MQLQDILNVVSTTTNQHESLIVGNSRKDKIVTARFLYFYLSKKHTKHTASEISNFVNRKDKTYFHALKKVEHWKKYDRDFRALFETINNQLSLFK